MGVVVSGLIQHGFKTRSTNSPQIRELYTRVLLFEEEESKGFFWGVDLERNRNLGRMEMHGEAANRIGRPVRSFTITVLGQKRRRVPVSADVNRAGLWRVVHAAHLIDATCCALVGAVRSKLQVKLGVQSLEKRY